MAAELETVRSLERLLREKVAKLEVTLNKVVCKLTLSHSMKRDVYIRFDRPPFLHLLRSSDVWEHY